ncbi:MAG: hypothetical protein OJF49_001447 [Ktedonobacterales bacterium]|jgi:WD40 repeat protein|nr:MAG: hypothetical protein OJF49_001447 [Ktedonobacterales bacterium]
MADEPDYYALLEVAPDADADAIRLAFRRLARRYHPDIAGASNLARMQMLSRAYHVLSDPDQRHTYDLQRFGHSPSAARSAAPPSPPPSPVGASAARPRTTPASAARPRTTPASAARTRPAAPRTGATSATSGPFTRAATLDTGETNPVAALALAHNGSLAGAGLLDGRVQIWDLRASRLLTTLAFGGSAGAGVLQELRLSPQGSYAAAWGLSLGTRIWNVATGAPIWTAAINSPREMMDIALLDSPPIARLALPDAPVALAEDDPFRWAYEGRHSTSLFTRPLVGPAGPAAAIPLRCHEPNGKPLSDRDDRWRIQVRALSADGRALFTGSSARTEKLAPPRVLHTWDLEHRNIFGALQPQRTARVAAPLDAIQFPLTVTPDLAYVAASFQGAEARVHRLAGGDPFVIPTGPIPEDALIALSPDAAYLALARDTHLDLWHVASGQHLQRWQCPAECTALTFATAAATPTLAVGLRNGLIEIWSVR